MSRLDDALKGVKKYRAKAKEVKKKLKDKAADFRTDDGYDWDAWKKSIKDGAKELKAEREAIQAETRKLSKEKREKRKKEVALYLDIAFYGIQFLLKFIPLGSGAQLFLKILNLLKFYKKF